MYLLHAFQSLSNAFSMLLSVSKCLGTVWSIHDSKVSAQVQVSCCKAVISLPEVARPLLTSACEFVIPLLRWLHALPDVSCDLALAG